MTNNIISNHPSLQYVEQPLLCEYVWKEQQPELSMDNKKSDLNDDTNNDNNNNNNRPNTDDGHEADGVDTPNEAEDEATIRTDNNGTTGKTVSPYEVYRREYCLKYIRAFFNQHLDDVWFRARYSPHSGCGESNTSGNGPSRRHWNYSDRHKSRPRISWRGHDWGTDKN